MISQWNHLIMRILLYKTKIVVSFKTLFSYVTQIFLKYRRRRLKISLKLGNVQSTKLVWMLLFHITFSFTQGTIYNKETAEFVNTQEKFMWYKYGDTILLSLFLFLKSSLHYFKVKYIVQNIYKYLNKYVALKFFTTNAGLILC